MHHVSRQEVGQLLLSFSRLLEFSQVKKRRSQKSYMLRLYYILTELIRQQFVSTMLNIRWVYEVFFLIFRHFVDFFVAHINGPFQKNYPDRLSFNFVALLHALRLHKSRKSKNHPWIHLRNKSSNAADGRLKLKFTSPLLDNSIGHDVT
jgi:hypothetical protein